MQDASAYVVLILVSIVISAAIGFFAYRKASAGAVRLFWLLTIFEIVWSIGNLLELMSRTLAGKLFWDNVQWLPTAAMPPLLLAFALRFTGRRLHNERIIWRIIVILSSIIVVLAWTDRWHGLMRTDARMEHADGLSGLAYGFEPVHHLANIFVLGQAVWGLFIIFQYFVRAPLLYRTQVGAILFGATVPFLAGLIAILDLDLGFERDMMPLSFIVLNLFIAWGLLGLRLFDVVPLAREMAIENLSDPIVVLDHEDRILDLNPPLKRILRLASPEDPVGKSAWDVFSRWPNLLDLFRGGSPPEGDLAVSEAGQTFWFNIRVMALTSRTGYPIGRLVIARDVTRAKLAELERLRYRDELEQKVQVRTAELAATNDRLRSEMNERAGVEAQLRQSQKMEALGRLAGGVAHDLNNLLVPILNYTQLVMDGIDPSSREHGQLAQVLKAAERAGDLARQILAFSRRQVLQLSVLDLNAAVLDIEGILRRLIGSDIHFRTELLKKPAPVLVDRSQLDQILVNLVVNARDAMPNGGELTIRVGESTVSELQATGDDWAIGKPAPGDYFTLEIMDTGLGMHETTLAQIFEPFFTTKAEGKGTGLGLSTVFGIVKQHGAALRVRSKLGSGTTFVIYFQPTERSSEAPATARGETIQQHGTETILVVDDEATVRAIAGHILRIRGYEVMETESPEAALLLAKTFENRIDLLVTDLVMPGMSGRTLADYIRAARPGIKVLFVSGYSDGEMADRGLLDRSEHYLAKPFTVDTLTQKVREILNNR